MARRKRTYALGKFNLRQSPELYSDSIAAFCKLCAKILALQARHCLRYQELCDGLRAGLGDASLMG